ncbi:ribonuclease H family protein [Ligilactobacillus agilis]|uniref:ribonuclease H family protein n=1 Tax=Ligilactobacillus agilis TaxID=1601 RepID=UPI00243331EB|nr:ribonuclease H family protein [Ligilactobacillus agilis]
MVGKFYAVKCGRQTGIFTSWPDCQKQVSGFPNARFKGFTDKTAALNWLNAESSTTQPSTSLKKATIQVYTDGGSRNHGNKLGQHVKADDKAAWAYLINTPTGSYEESGGEYGSTNNRMEIMAFLQALKKLLALGLNHEPLEFVLDSRYVLDSLTKGWLTSWQRRNWRKADGNAVLNKELWQEVATLLPNFSTPYYTWTKGHANNPGNNRVDYLLNQTMDQM